MHGAASFQSWGLEKSVVASHFKQKVVVRVVFCSYRLPDQFELDTMQ